METPNPDADRSSSSPLTDDLCAASSELLEAGLGGAPVAATDVLSLLRVMADAVSDGVVILDAGDRVVGFNQAFADLTGYSADEAPFEPPFPWWPTEAENAAAHRAIAGALHATGAGAELDSDLLIFRRDRRPLVVQSKGAGLVAQDGTVVARVRIVRDLTRDRSSLEHRRDAARAAVDFATRRGSGRTPRRGRHQFQQALRRRGRDLGAFGQ